MGDVHGRSHFIGNMPVAAHFVRQIREEVSFY